MSKTEGDSEEEEEEQDVTIHFYSVNHTSHQD